MRFNITICNKDDRGNSWGEIYEEDTEDPQAWAEDTIKRFNSYLRSGEKERVLLNVEIIDNHSVKKHAWEKQNAMTIGKSGDYYDVLKCGRCGITAKRYSVDKIILDSEFSRAKVYLRCDTSLVHLKKLKEQRRM